MSARPVVVLALLASIVAAAPAAARSFSLDLGGGGQRLFTSSGMRLVGQTTYGGTAIRAAAEVKPQSEIGLSWWHPTQSSDDRPELSGHAAIADLRHRALVAPWFEPYAKVGLGALVQSVEISGAGGSLAGRAIVPLGMVAGGFDLLIPPAAFALPGSKGGFAMGLSFELGWLHALGARYDLQGGREITPAIPQAGVDLGEATLSGLWTRFAFTVRL